MLQQKIKHDCLQQSQRATNIQEVLGGCKVIVRFYKYLPRNK